MENRYVLPVLGFAAFSGVGKTTLLRELMPALQAYGLNIGIVKHAHHEFDTDIPGKDSYELRKAGAAQTLVASRKRQALITETPNASEPRLADLVRLLDSSRLDLVLVEGFKGEPIPKIELHRPSLEHPLLCIHNDSVIALATDAPLGRRPTIPLLDLNRPDQIANFVLQRFFGSSVVQPKLACR